MKFQQGIHGVGCLTIGIAAVDALVFPVYFVPRTYFFIPYGLFQICQFGFGDQLPSQVKPGCREVAVDVECLSEVILCFLEGLQRATYRAQVQQRLEISWLLPDDLA